MREVIADGCEETRQKKAIMSKEEKKRERERQDKNKKDREFVLRQVCYEKKYT